MNFWFRSNRARLEGSCSSESRSLLLHPPQELVADQTKGSLIVTRPSAATSTPFWKASLRSLFVAVPSGSRRSP